MIDPLFTLEHDGCSHAAHADDFAFPDDWRRESNIASPVDDETLRHESIYFSPACLDPNEASAEQGVLL